MVHSYASIVSDLPFKAAGLTCVCLAKILDLLALRVDHMSHALNWQ